MTESTSSTLVQPANEAPPATPLVEVASEELFHGEREVCILHEGERYRLRITRRGKLILQK
jgi:hemin uptake protein HemP